MVVQKIYVRDYPLGGLAAQLFGTVGPINGQEIGPRPTAGSRRTRSSASPGSRRLRPVPARHRRRRRRSRSTRWAGPPGESTVTAPVAGHNLSLSLSESLQRVGQHVAAAARSTPTTPPAAGAFVAMNPQNGSDLRDGLAADLQPEDVHRQPVSQRTYNQLQQPGAHEPLLNRAIAGVGPTGSTFKPITATAALESGAWTVGSTYDDTGSLQGRRADPAQRGQRRQRLARPASTRSASPPTPSSTTSARGPTSPIRSTQPQGGAAADVGAAVRDRAPDRDRHRRRSRRARCPRRPGASSRNRHRGRLRQPHPPDPAVPDTIPSTSCRRAAAGSPTGPTARGRSATTSTSPSARATCRSRRCSWPSPTRRWPTAARSSRPHVGLNVQNQDGTVLQNINPAAVAPHPDQPDLPGDDPPGPARGGLAAGRHLGRGLLQLPRAGLRQDRHRPVQRPERLLVVCLLRARLGHDQADRRRRPRRAGRLRRRRRRSGGARRSCRQWFFGKPGPYVAGSSQDAVSALTRHPARRGGPGRQAAAHGPAAGPAAAARRGRAGRLLGAHPAQRDPQHGPGRAPGHLRRDRRDRGADPQPAGLLAAARVQATACSG